jgi:hypothetical protein
MIRFIKVAVLFILSSIFISMNFKNSESVKVKFVVGLVEYRSSGTYETKRLTTKVNLLAGDEVFTKLQSRAELELFDGSIIKIGESSVFQIKEMEKKSESSSLMSFGLKIGSIWAKFKKVFSSSSEREIQTPSAVVAIRGTELGITVEPATGKTKVQVKEGTVSVKDNKSKGEVYVNGNQQTTIEQGKEPNKPFRYDHRGENEMNNNGSDSESDNNEASTEKDQFKPNIKIDRKLNANFVNDRQYVLSGHVFDRTENDEISVTLDGVKIQTVKGKGSFRHTISLNEGENIITVVVSDLAGNSNSATERLFLDTNKPFVRFFSGLEPLNLKGRINDNKPANPPRTGLVRKIRGTVIDPGKSSGIKFFAINGKEVQLKPDNTFEFAVRLSVKELLIIKERKKPIEILIRIEDLAGNQTIDRSKKIIVF